MDSTDRDLWRQISEQFKLGVTTATDPTEALIASAKALSEQLGCPMVDRGRRGLKHLLAHYKFDRMFVVTHECIVLHSVETSVFWNPGTAYLKLWQPSQNKPLDLLVATALGPGDQVLDCTLGYGSDAIVCSWAVGREGRVVGLEADGPMAYLTAQGMKGYQKGPTAMLEAMRRIEVWPVDHLTYLRGLPDGAFDVVYFDPMFVEGVSASPSMVPLRHLACLEGISQEAWQEAKRVARRRVVVKERIGSGVFEALGVQQKVGGWRKGHVAYGWIEELR